MNRDEARELYLKDPAALWDDAHKRGEESWGGERVAFACWRAQQTAAVLELLYPYRDELKGRRFCDLGTGGGCWQALNTTLLMWSIGIDISRQSSGALLVDDISKPGLAERIAADPVMLLQPPYSLVLCMNTLRHIIDDDGVRVALKNAADILAPQGLFVMSYLREDRAPEDLPEPVWYKLRPEIWYKKAMWEAGLITRGWRDIEPVDRATAARPDTIALARKRG